MALTNSGPYTLPGNNFINSHPISSAHEISVNDPQPGDHKTFLRLHIFAISFLKTGVTTKLAPANMYCEAEEESVIEPTPRIIPGNSLIANLFNSLKISKAKSPLLVNSSRRDPP